MQSDNFTQRADRLPGCARPQPHQLHLRHERARAAGRSSRIGCGSSRLVYYRGSGNDISACSTTRTPATSPSGPTWPTPSRPAKSDGNGPLQPTLRLTVQVTPRNKLNLFWDEQISSDSIGAGLRDGRARDRRPGTTAASACSRPSGRRRRRTSCCSRRASARTCRTGTRARRPGNDRAPDSGDRTVHGRLRRPTAASQNLVVPRAEHGTPTGSARTPGTRRRRTSPAPTA